MTRAGVWQQLKKPSSLGVIGLGVAALLVVGLFLSTQNNTATQQNDVLNQEAAYSNVVKESLNVYRSRYSHYPKNYQVLLDDIAAGEDIYGVNSEGMGELKDINSRLPGFSYEQVGDEDYLFTYKSAASDEIVSVTNK